MKQLIQRRRAIEPYYSTSLGRLYCGDSLATLKSLPSESVQCCVTSPPYWGLRDYGNDNQIGLEKTPEEYVIKMVELFRELRRVLKSDGTLWLNLGDSYCGGGRGFEYWSGNEKQSTNKGSAVKATPVPKGYKSKDLVGVPWMVAFALRTDGWYLRQDIIWAKPNLMPESVTDRCTKSHEYLFLLSKNQKYYYDSETIGEKLLTLPHKPGNNFHPDKVAGPNDRGGKSQWDDTKDREWCKSGFRNKRSVWTINTEPYPEAHFATFPLKLIEPCIRAGTKKGDTVLDPFMGSGTTGYLCEILDRKWIGIELNQTYCDLAKKRINQEALKPKLF